MTSLYEKSIELQTAFNNLNVTPPKNYQEKLIRAYDQIFFDELFEYFSENQLLNEDHMRLFLKNGLTLFDSTPANINTRPDSLVRKLLRLIADEFDKDGDIMPRTVIRGAEEDAEPAERGFSSELVEFLGESAAIENKDEAQLVIQLGDDQILMFLKANKYIGASLINLYGVNTLVTLLYRSNRDLNTVSDVLECLMTQNPGAFLREEIGSLFESLAKDKALLFAELYFKTLIIKTEQVINVFSQLNMEQRKDIYDALSDQFHELIKDACDLSETLQFLPEEQQQSVLEQISYKLPLFIDSPSNLIVVLRELTDEHTKLVLDAVKYYLPQVIFNDSDTNSGFDNVIESIMYSQSLLFIHSLVNSFEDCFNAFQYAHEDTYELIIESVKHKLSDLITNADQLTAILEFLDKKQSGVVIESCYERLITDSNQLVAVLELQSRSYRGLVIDSVQRLLPNMISNAYQLVAVLELLDQKDRLVVINSVSMQWLELIKNAKQLANVLVFLNKTQRRLVLDSVQDSMPGLFINVEQVLEVLELLHEEQHILVIKPIQEKLRELITDVEQLVEIIKTLNYMSRVFVRASLLNKLPELLTNADQLVSVLECLTQFTAERGSVISIVKAKLPSLFIDANANQLVTILDLLAIDPEGRRLVLDSVQESLPNLLTNADELVSVLECLAEDSEEREFVIRTMETRLPGLFAEANSNQLVAVLKLLTQDPEPRELLIESMEDVLPNLLTNADELVSVLQCLAEDSEEREFVIRTVEARLPGLFADANQSVAVLELLAQHPEERELVLESVQDSLPNLLTNADELVSVLQCLAEDSEERGSVIRTMETKLPGLFTDANQLVAALELLAQDPEERELVLESVQESLSNLLTNADELVSVLECLAEDSEEREFVIRAVEAKLPSLFADANQLATVLKLLAEGECNLVIASVREQLPDLIIDVEQLMLVMAALFEPQAAEILLLVANSSEFSEQLFAQERTYSVTNAEQHVLDMLKQFGKKSLDLVRDDKIDKAIDALYLYNNVNVLFERYQQSPKSSSDNDTFYKQSAELINNAKNSELKHHSGWKELFINLLIGIASLGLAFVVNKIVTGGRCSFFSVNTDSLNKVDELGAALQAMTASPS